MAEIGMMEQAWRWLKEGDFISCSQPGVQLPRWGRMLHRCLPHGSQKQATGQSDAEPVIIETALVSAGHSKQSEVHGLLDVIKPRLTHHLLDFGSQPFWHWMSAFGKLRRMTAGRGRTS